jgi:hypothetical protein
MAAPLLAGGAALIYVPRVVPKTAAENRAPPPLCPLRRQLMAVSHDALHELRRVESDRPRNKLGLCCPTRFELKTLLHSMFTI